MRIRTIKPEFWSHPVMARQDDAVKLMAIGLLNYADDEGYFYADPLLIRAALRPLDEDSTIVRRSIARLAEMGYIEVRECAENPDDPSSFSGPLGRVVSFSSHQRVDRANHSKIKPVFDSTNDRRTIDERSTLERKGKEGNISIGRMTEIKDGSDRKSESPSKSKQQEMEAQAEEIYQAYPRKTAKPAGVKAIKQALKKVEYPVLLAATKRYAIERVGQDPTYTPHPATWFNQERFNDTPTGRPLPVQTQRQLPPIE